MKRIDESQALMALMQMYQSKMSMVNSATISILIGLFIVPLFAFSANVGAISAEHFGFPERFFCFILTTGLAIAGVYYVRKTIFLGALLWETMIHLKIEDNRKSLLECHVGLKTELSDKYTAFKKYKLLAHQHEESSFRSSYARQVRTATAGSYVVTLILFLLIWWVRPYAYVLLYVLASELIYILLNRLFSRFAHVF